MDVRRAILLALAVVVRTAPALAATADVAATGTATGDFLRGSRHPSRGLQHVADNGRSDSFDDAIDADHYAADTGVNPDSGDEDYTIQDWVEDPSTDETIEVDAYEYYNSTVYQYNYTGPLLEEPGNGLGEGMLNVCQGDCDYDLECAEGLVCWYDDGSLKVPGCSGTALEYWEYCIDPGALPDKSVTHSDTLVDFGDDLGAVSLGHCQGDCDYDIDCVGDDVCFYADGTGIVPGCDGAPTSGWEYCADPQVIKEHRAKIGLENLNSTDGYCPASVPYEGRVEVGSVNGTLANEVSGMVNGRRNPNVLYVHNDRNNAPRLMAIHKNNGRMVGNWNIGGINHTDYEDISNGPGPKPGVNYLHLCDIGDNPYDRTTIEIHRLPEPALTGPIGPKTFYPQTLTLHYPDGPKNAEACLVDPLTGLIYIMQKTRRTSKIYRTEAPWGDGDETMNLMLAGTVSNLRKPARWGNALTGIDISPNGRDIVMLYYGGLDYRCRDANESVEDALGRFGLLLPAYVEEPQGGEAIAFSTDMTGLYSCQESGGWSEVPLYRYPATISGLLEGRSSAASPPPSMMPSSAPTHKPSAAPTYAPVSPAPTRAPVSPAPTDAPISQAPTDAPFSLAPTDAPVSSAPTDAPISQTPTDAPVSPAPTEAPISQAPTNAPVSPAPTDAPISLVPTEAPISQAPTDAPVSPAPTEAPISLIPTKTETKTGIETRTESANDEPSKSPTSAAQGKEAEKNAKKELKNRQKREKEDAKGAAKAEEERNKNKEKASDKLPITSSPSKPPVTSEPSAAPVTNPASKAPATSEPTSAPVSATPTDAPITSSPSKAPVTSEPTSAPVSAAPTDAPITSSPSKAPVTSEPTSAPISAAPTDAPVTSSPSKAPVTSEPTASPSEHPSAHPSSSPSSLPSVVPSLGPTVQPSDVPSDVPSNVPSDVPSDLPSSEPSTDPSGSPSSSPSSQPSSSPSSLPSTAPTTKAHGKEAAKIAEKELKNRMKEEKEAAKAAAEAEELRLKNQEKAAKELAKAEEEGIRDEDKDSEILVRTEDEVEGKAEKKSGGSRSRRRSDGSGASKSANEMFLRTEEEIEGKSEKKSGGSKPPKSGPSKSGGSKPNRRSGASLGSF